MIWEFVHGFLLGVTFTILAFSIINMKRIKKELSV